MAETLRPMGTSELLDRTFALYRRNFWLFVGIAALAPAIQTAAAILLAALGALPKRTPSPASAAYTPDALAGIFIGVAITLFVMMIGFVITQAATIRAVSAVHLGLPITIREAYASLRGQYGRIFGVFLLISLYVFGVSLGLILLAVIVGGLGVAGGSVAGTGGLIAGGLLAVLVAVAAAFLAVAFFVRYSLAVQACIVEHAGVRQSLKRSAFLSKGSRKRILTVYTLFVILSWIIGAGLGIFTLAIDRAMQLPLLATVFSYVTGFVAGALTGPLVTIGISLVYYDERVRKEAFDLQLMMSAMDAQANPAPAPGN